MTSTLQTLTSGQTVITSNLFIFSTIRYQLEKVIRWVKWDESVCNGEGGIAIHRTIWSLNWQGPREALAESLREIRGHYSLNLNNPLTAGSRPSPGVMKRLCVCEEERGRWTGKKREVLRLWTALWFHDSKNCTQNCSITACSKTSVSWLLKCRK